MSATWGKQNPDARARLAQSAERKAPNLVVVGSRPTGGWITFLTPGQKPEIGIARLARAAERKDFSIVVEVSGGNWLAITHLPTHLPTRDRFASRFSLDAGHGWQTGRIHVLGVQCYPAPPIPPDWVGARRWKQQVRHLL